MAERPGPGSRRFLGSLDPEFSFRQIVESTTDIVIVTQARPVDRPGPEIVYVNKAFTALTEFTPEEAVGRTPRILQGPGTSGANKARLRRAMEEQIPARTTLLNYSKSGRPYWLDINMLPLRNSAGEVTHFAAIERDITEEIEARAELQRLAAADPLTGLLNCRVFIESLEEEIERARRYGHPLSLIVLDIDRFKKINDTHGHQIGDAALRAIAETISGTARSVDRAGRLGGEEFALVLPETDVVDAARFAERLRERIAACRVEAEGKSIAVTASLGVAGMKGPNETCQSFVRRADRAMYLAKDAGRDRVVLAQAA
ncbi:MAG: diguanylate cyclase [Kiloniellales bacterium]|nr:diguanylate cyclase [Kiloniellales bacterium]